MTFQSDNGKAFLGDLTNKPILKISLCSSTLGDLQSTDEWTSGKAKQNACEFALGILLEVFVGLGQKFAAIGGSIQQQTTLNNWDWCGPQNMEGFEYLQVKPA